MKRKFPLLTLLTCGLVFRILYHMTYRPWWCGDSGGYTGPFRMWLQGIPYRGERTPIYPLFLGFAQGLAGSMSAVRMSVPAAYVTTALQSLAGMMSICLLYYTLRELEIDERIGFWATLLFALLGGVAAVETILLPISISLSSLILAVWLFVRTMRNTVAGRMPWRLAVLTGLAAGLSTLVRAENLILFTSLVLFTAALAIRLALLPAWRALAARLAKVVLVLPLAAATVIFPWTFCNYLTIGQFRITTIMGYQLTHAVYNLFDRVDPEDRVLGEIMTRYYHQANWPGHEERAYVWNADREINARQAEMPISKDYPKLQNLNVGDYVGDVSRKLMRKYPAAYLWNVARNTPATFDFMYGTPVPKAVILPTDDPQSVEGKSAIRSRHLWRGAVWINRIDAVLLAGLYSVTLGAFLAGLFLFFRSGISESRIRDLTVCALAMGMLGTFLAFCFVERYYSPYGLPFLGVVVVVSAFAWHKAVGAFSRRPAESPAAGLGVWASPLPKGRPWTAAGAGWLAVAVLSLFLFSVAGVFSTAMINFARLHFARPSISFRKAGFSSLADKPVDFGKLPALAEGTMTRIRFRYRAAPSSHPYPNLFQTAPGNDGLRMEFSSANATVLFSDDKARLMGVDCAGCGTGAWHAVDIRANEKELQVRIDEQLYPSPEATPMVKFTDLKLGEGFSPDRTFSGEIADFEASYYPAITEIRARHMYYALRTLLLGVFVFASLMCVRRRNG